MPALVAGIHVEALRDPSTWMAGTSPWLSGTLFGWGKTRNRSVLNGVTVQQKPSCPGLTRASMAATAPGGATWMAGSSPAMTIF
jgi:hypothetical protein